LQIYFCFITNLHITLSVMLILPGAIIKAHDTCLNKHTLIRILFKISCMLLQHDSLVGKDRLASQIHQFFDLCVGLSYTLGYQI